jgi:hypothetical protein
VSGLVSPDTVDRAVQRADRERLTQLLRGLAADLDQLDRQLCDLAWRRPRMTAAPAADLRGQHAFLQTRREQLTDELRSLAAQLSVADSALCGLRAHDTEVPATVGTCPQCGYPSLSSGLCAHCRPYLQAHHR